MQVLSRKDITLSGAWTRYRESTDFSTEAVRTQQTEITRIKPVLAVLDDYLPQALQDAPRLIYDFINHRSKEVSAVTADGYWQRKFCSDST